jgi:hypothetical protein
MGAVYPFSKLIADRALIRISFFWLFDFDTPRDQVRSIRAHYEVARSGVVIEPLYPATPRSFIWTHKPEPILKALAQRGYPVEWVDRIELLR